MNANREKWNADTASDTTLLSLVNKQSSVIDPHGMSDRERLLTLIIMAFGTFMAVLDTQIVASSLPEIQGGLSATAEEISSVQTSYLIAEVIMIPLSGWFSALLSTRWLFTLSAAGFTVASIACGFAWNLQSIIVFRAMQGFVGGAMIPTAFATGFILFPGAKQARIAAILGLAATLAPTLGPTIGGVITAHLSWRWLFFVNLLPGALITLTIPYLVKIDRPNPQLMRQLDVIGLVALALFLGGLQYVLDEGSRKDWFGSQVIAGWSCVSACAALVFIWRSLANPTPLVDLRAFRTRNFTLGCAFSFILGLGIYGAVYLLPLYLGLIRGFSALQIGTTLFATGCFQLAAMPIVVLLYRRLDIRYSLAIGFGLFAMSCYLLNGVTSQWGFEQLLLPQALRGVATMFCIVPLTSLALGSLTPQELKGASGLYSLMRNLGGAIGLAVLNTQLFYGRLDHNRDSLSPTLTAGSAPAARYFDQVTNYLDGRVTDPERMSRLTQRLLKHVSDAQALTLSFADIFLLIAIIFLCAFLAIPLISKLAATAGKAATE